MYRVVLVDDERLILRGLSTVVPWAELGCEVAGTAHDGADGLEQIRKIRPDIVLTDIRMPNMDGLTMLAAIRSEFPEIQMSVLRPTGISITPGRRLRWAYAATCLNPATWKN